MRRENMAKVLKFDSDVVLLGQLRDDDRCVCDLIASLGKPEGWKTLHWVLWAGSGLNLLPQHTGWRPIPPALLPERKPRSERYTLCNAQAFGIDHRHAHLSPTFRAEVRYDPTHGTPCPVATCGGRPAGCYKTVHFQGKEKRHIARLGDMMARNVTATWIRPPKRLVVPTWGLAAAVLLVTVRAWRFTLCKTYCRPQPA